MAGRRAGAGQMLLSHRLAFSVTWSHVSLVKRSLKWLPHDMSCSRTPEFLCLPGLTRSCVQYTQHRCADVQRRSGTLKPHADVGYAVGTVNTCLLADHPTLIFSLR